MCDEIKNKKISIPKEKEIFIFEQISIIDKIYFLK